MHDGVPIVELINNWRCASFEDTYRSPVITDRIRHVLQTLRPDVVHVHNLLNLSFDLPACAQELGIPVVATLHDYTLVCASGGQRVHRRDQHICHDIEPDRCARCFAESPFIRASRVRASHARRQNRGPGRPRGRSRATELSGPCDTRRDGRTPAWRDDGRCERHRGTPGRGAQSVSRCGRLRVAVGVACP
jgi:glycosyltransferase involved in cell wall biosynthesis